MNYHGIYTLKCSCKNFTFVKLRGISKLDIKNIKFEKTNHYSYFAKSCFRK